MQRRNLERFLKKIHRGLRINRHSNRGEHIYHGGSDALFCYTRFVGAIPPGNIYKIADTRYSNGQYSHRSLRGLLYLLLSKGILKPEQYQTIRREIK